MSLHAGMCVCEKLTSYVLYVYIIAQILPERGSFLFVAETLKRTEM